MTDSPLRRALLVEDDPVSAAFLEAALARVPLRVDPARDCAGARTLAARTRYDLWVFDANLPDGRGDALLRALRHDAPGTPALAHTAAREAAEHEALLQAGFLEVLVKPLSTAEIVVAARMALGLAASVPSMAATAASRPLWDEDAALRALLGERAHLVALRALFRPELEGLEGRLHEAMVRGDDTDVASQLHRLRASCGFVGAARLGDAAATLATGDVRAGWPAFAAVLRETLDQFPAG
ncbi:MAG TPA: response regulator [Lysobacter sp.]